MKEERIVLSKFGRFLTTLKGYDFFTKAGSVIDRWELYEMGYDAIDLINRNTSVYVQKSPQKK